MPGRELFLLRFFDLAEGVHEFRKDILRYIHLALSFKQRDVRLVLPVEIGAGSGSQVFHLEFLGPDGKEVPVYAKNLRFENGRGAYEFQTAFNDPKGTWTLLVKNVNSGLAAKTAVELK